MKDTDVVKFPTWEIVAVIIGYFSTVKEVPEILNMVLVCYEKNKIPPSFNQVTMLGYALLLFIVSTYFFIKENYTRSEFEAEKGVQDIYDQIRLIEYLKTFGIEYIFDKFRDLAGISLYDAFTRPSSWEKDNSTYKNMYRMWIRKSASLELRIRKDLYGLDIRSASEEQFGEVNTYTFWQLENKFLGFISIPLMLFTIANILLTPFHSLMRNKPYVSRIIIIL